MSLNSFSPHVARTNATATPRRSPSQPDNHNNCEDDDCGDDHQQHHEVGVVYASSSHHRQLQLQQQEQQQQDSQPYTIPTIGQLYMFNHGDSNYHQLQQQQYPAVLSSSKIPTPIPIPTLRQEYQYLYVLPVLLLEFLAIALTRAVLPAILLKAYPNNVYIVLGVADCLKGLLAFWSCPWFGKISDQIGRKVCLFVTVLGTCAPVCSLAFTYAWNNANHNMAINESDSEQTTTNTGWGEVWSEQQQEDLTTISSAQEQEEMLMNGSTTDIYPTTTELPPMAIPTFVVLLSLSGIFSSTFPLVFAYISDTVKPSSSSSSSSEDKNHDRVAAYGLALATFGLSFTIGPMAGGYLAQYNTHYVFLGSLALTIVDLLYIYFVLPESLPQSKQPRSVKEELKIIHEQHRESIMNNIDWKPWDTTIRLIVQDPFLKHVGQVAFLYYTGLYAVISTLSIYAVEQFDLSPERLGELMSALGLCTMIAEAVLVRVLVPLLGEKRSTRIGLLSFACQCFVLGGATKSWHLFICVAFSLLGNLVYPSLSSLVSNTVEPDRVGEALGAMNGIKALTEGLGPLLFGALMTISENSTIPGWPYWIAGIFVLGAYHVSETLPDGNHDDDGYLLLASLENANDGNDNIGTTKPRYYDGKEDYIHELEFKQRRKGNNIGDPRSMTTAAHPSNSAIATRGCLDTITDTMVDYRLVSSPSYFETPMRDDENEEYEGLLTQLSEIEESENETETDVSNHIYDDSQSHTLPRSPIFGSLSPPRSSSSPPRKS